MRPDDAVKPTLLLVGPLPPPYHGITVSTARLLDSRLRDEFRLVHFDTSDHRDMDNLGRTDPRNVLLALKHVILFFFLCLRERPDLVYTTINQNVAYARDGLFLAIGKWIGGAKVIAHLRGAYFQEFYRHSSWPVRWFVDVTIRRADRVIVLGDCLKPIFSRWFPDSALDVVPNGTPFRPDLSRRQPESGEKVIVAYLGNLIEEKGVVDLVRAVPEVVRGFPEAEFRFAGAWWDHDEAERKCREFVQSGNLENRVRFLGVLRGREKEDFLLSADIFVFPTYYTYEGHPNVILEAMAAGLPVISTDWVAIPETVVDGVTGILAPIRDPGALARAVLSLARDPDLRRRMGEAGRERYEKLYTQEANIANMIAAFRRCLTG